jgi:hypothetical protein
MSATTAGEPGPVAGAAPQRPGGAAVPGRRVWTAVPGPRAGAGGRGGPAVPGRSGAAAVPGRRVVAAVPGRRVVAAVPRKRVGVPIAVRQAAAVPELPDGTAERHDRPRTARPRPTALTVVPPLRTVAVEPPGAVVPGAVVPGAVVPGAAAPGTGSAAGLRAPRVARSAPRRPAGSRARPRSHLTRRGRIVVSALVLTAMLAVAALAWLAGTARADAARGGASLAAVRHDLRPVIVRPGQSLWTIATQAAPTADPRSVIQEIIDINALGGTAIQPGQRLWVPRN